MTVPTRKSASLRQRLLWALGPVLTLALMIGLLLWAGQLFLAGPAVPPARPSNPAGSGAPLSPVPTPSPPSPPTVSPLPAPTSTPRVAPTLSLEPAEVLLDATNTDRYAWPAGALFHPHGLVLLSDTAYMVDAGQVVALSLPQASAVRLFPPDGRVDDIPVGEISALAASPDGAGLLLLDKRGDMYRFDPGSGEWRIERPIDKRRTSPNPVLLAVAPYDGRAYILDTTYSQVWRFPFGQGVAEGYFQGGDSPNKRAGTDADVTRGIDVAVYNDVYILLRPGLEEPAGLRRFVGSPPERDRAFGSGLDLVDPTRLYLDAPGGPLYLLDRAGQRLRALDKKRGTVLQTLAFGDGLEMRAVSVAGGRLYIAAGDALYVYPGTGQVRPVAGGAGPDPLGRPDNLAVWAPLQGMVSPISGVRYLPERDSLLPGTTRIYRYGIHHGLDMYEDVMGVDLTYGAPAHAIADGVVVRADHGYEELTPAQWSDLAALCDRLHMTPPEVEDRFRGRQVWVDHGNGLVSRYEHLSGIPQEVVAGAGVRRGQVVGYVGNSGTSDGANGTRGGAHLHFEIYLDGHYLGEWLSLWETRQLLQRLFFP